MHTKDVIHHATCPEMTSLKSQTINTMKKKYTNYTARDDLAKKPNNKYNVREIYK